MDLITRIRLLAVPRDEILTRERYSQRAINEMEQQGLVTQTEVNRLGQVRQARLSVVGRKTRRHLLEERLAGTNRKRGRSLDRTGTPMTLPDSPT